MLCDIQVQHVFIQVQLDIEIRVGVVVNFLGKDVNIWTMFLTQLPGYMPLSSQTKLEQFGFPNCTICPFSFELFNSCEIKC